ncbi:hypothetical protein FH551_26605 [Salmonella enterica]|nr:hypothetical protein [Salmonella enterica]
MKGIALYGKMWGLLLLIGTYHTGYGKVVPRDIIGSTVASPVFLGVGGVEQYCTATISDVQDEVGTTPDGGATYYAKATGSCTSWILSKQYAHSYEPAYVSGFDGTGIYPEQVYCSLYNDTFITSVQYMFGLHTNWGGALPYIVGANCQRHPNDDYWVIPKVMHPGKPTGTLERRTPVELKSLSSKGIPRTRVMLTFFVDGDIDNVAFLVPGAIVSAMIPTEWAINVPGCNRDNIRVVLYILSNKPGAAGVIEEWSVDNDTGPAGSGIHVPTCTLVSP